MLKRIKHSIFIYHQKILHKEKKGFFVFLLLFFLYILSLGWKFFVFCKNTSFEIGLRKQKKVKPCVVSIGNLVAGGTGKTPLTAYFCQKLIKKHKVGILSRGYGSKFEKSHFQIDSSNNKFSWQDVGDEPYLLAKKFQKEATLFIGRDRLFSAKEAEGKKLDVLILDDGLQYRSLYRDFEIIVLNANDLFGKGFFLPRGYLRDSLKRLSQADLILVNHVHTQNQFSKILKNLQKWTKTKVVGMHPIINAIKDLKGNEIDLKNEKVAAFCSIAHPEQFFDLLSKNHMEVAAKYILADHQKIEFSTLCQFANSSKSKANWMICTEKDRVKLEKQMFCDLPIAFVEMGLQLQFGESQMDNLLEKIYEKINNV